MSNPICHDCGKEIPPPEKDTIATGYGRNEKGEPVCYPCCAVQDRKYMDTHDRIVLYLTGLRFYAEGKGLMSACDVSNWPGSLKFKAFVRRGRHNWARVVYNVRFHDHNGNAWSGRCVGDNTQICHCRKLKPR